MEASSTSASPAPAAPEVPASKVGATQARLRRLLERYGQSELARMTGIPQPRLSRWKAGDVPAAADDALKLLEFEESLAKETDKTQASQDADRA